MTRVGLISDTHGLMRPEALAFLAGCDHIVHAGDIGKPHVLASLAAIAPLTAVRGNNDTDAWAHALPEVADLRAEGVTVRVVHDIAELALAAPVPQVVVSGHSHKPGTSTRDGILYVNPGSAGPRRFKFPVTVAELRIEGTRATPRIVELDVAPPKQRSSRAAGRPRK